jgi:hypothetical protein
MSGGGFGFVIGSAQWEYLTADSPKSLAEFKTLLESRGKEGWEYCGLSPSLPRTAPVTGQGPGGDVSVLVFKRAKRGGVAMGGAVGGGPMGPGPFGPNPPGGGGFGGGGFGFGGPGGGFGGTTTGGLGNSTSGTSGFGGQGGTATSSTFGGMFGSGFGPGFGPRLGGGTTGTTGGSGSGKAAADGETQVVRLKNASAADVAAALNAIYARSPKTVQVVAEPVSNNLLIYAEGGAMAEVHKLVVQLDDAKATSTQPGGPGMSPAPRGPGSGRPSGPGPGRGGGTSASGSSGTSSTTGTSDASGSTTGTTTGDKREFTVVQLKHSKAEDIARVLTELFGAGNSRLRVVAEVSSNSLVISGSTSDVETVRALLEKLDGLAPDAGRKR